MGRRTYHILTESEPFSEERGGAISRIVASLLRDDPCGIVVAPSADNSWGFPPQRVVQVPGLFRYIRVRKALSYRLPRFIIVWMLRGIFRSPLQDAKAGDVVWIHNRPEFVTALAPRMRARGVSVVLHLHNSLLLDTPQGILRTLKIDRAIFVSHFLEKEASGRLPAGVATSVLHNGADAERFCPAGARLSDGSELTVLFVGRIIPEKGVHLLVEALALLHARQVAVTGLIVGSADYRGGGRTPYAIELHRTAPPNVRFEPYCSGAELAEKFRKADIFCAPVTWDEPFGMVNVEAMAAALPVVTTRSGGIPEVFEEGGGLLVEKDSALEIADSIEKLIKQPALRERLGREGRASFMKHFSWPVLRQQYQTIVDSL